MLHCILLVLIWSSLSWGYLQAPMYNVARDKTVTATATCGEGGAEGEEFCDMQGLTCDYCNGSDVSRAYPASNAVALARFAWQSPPLSRGLQYDQVNFTVDLRQTFSILYITVRMGSSPRPGLWVLEKSLDGSTWEAWQYFAESPEECQEKFGAVADPWSRTDNEAICSTQESRIFPMERGAVSVSLAQGRPGVSTMSLELQHFMSARFVRLRLLRTMKFITPGPGADLRGYYYSIRDIQVYGSCQCHGHADRCDVTDLLTGQHVCRCRHNTCGANCQECCEGFRSHPWRPTTLVDQFVCE